MGLHQDQDFLVTVGKCDSSFSEGKKLLEKKQLQIEVLILQVLQPSDKISLLLYTSFQYIVFIQAR